MVSHMDRKRRLMSSKDNLALYYMLKGEECKLQDDGLYHDFDHDHENETSSVPSKIGLIFHMKWVSNFRKGSQFIQMCQQGQNCPCVCLK